MLNTDFLCIYVQHLNLSGNRIRSLEGLEEHGLLESIDIEDNEVSILTHWLAFCQSSFYTWL